jgi:hypothetical protein
MVSPLQKSTDTKEIVRQKNLRLHYMQDLFWMIPGKSRGNLTHSAREQHGFMRCEVISFGNMNSKEMDCAQQCGYRSLFRYKSEKNGISKTICIEEESEFKCMEKEIVDTGTSNSAIIFFCIYR